MTFKQWMKVATGLRIRDAYFTKYRSSLAGGLHYIQYNPVAVNGMLIIPPGMIYTVTGVFNKRLFLKPKFQVKDPSGGLCWQEWEEDAWTILKDDNLFYRSILELE